MGLCIYYRSVEPMHPASAFDISQHAQRLQSQYRWLRCEPVVLSHTTDGLLRGGSKPNFVASEVDFDPAEFGNLPDGTLMTLVEVLCELSRSHEVVWELAHDYGAESMGRIHCGVAEEALMEQLEAIDSIGELLDDLDHEDVDPFDLGLTEQQPLPAAPRRARR